MIEIRDPRAGDEAEWRRLWAGYLEFYGTVLPAEVTDATWRRIRDPAAPLFARLAAIEGRVVGFAVAVLHEGSWVTAPVCYLEDLYVDPAARGRGAGGALIDDLVRLARERGWSRLYWHTRADNPARRLYDRHTAADGFVRYRLTFGDPG